MPTLPEPDFQQPPEEAVSLRELSDAFAEAMGNRRQAVPEPEDHPQHVGVTNGESAPSTEAEALESPGDGSRDADIPRVTPDARPDNDPCEINPASILEAMLFVGNSSGEPLTSLRASELMRGVAADEIPALVDQLNRRYAARGCPYFIASEGAGYRMTLRREFWPIRNRFYGRIREVRLSQAAIDVLAIVAYRQPVTAETVGQFRGHPSGHLLRQLVHRRLLRIERTDSAPRIARYWTTDRFLGLFGLESLTDLPRSDEDVDAK